MSPLLRTIAGIGPRPADSRDFRVLASVALLLAMLCGCEPHMQCAQGTDGPALLKSLSESALPLEFRADQSLRLLTSCQPQGAQLDTVKKTVEQIASIGTGALQSSFYLKLSELVPQSPLRLDFIARSTLIGGGVKAVEEDFSLVEFENLGKEYDPKTAPPTLVKALADKASIDMQTAIVRIVETDGGPVIFLRETATSGVSELSSLRVLDAKTSEKVTLPKEDFDYLLVRPDDEHFVDYFFGCMSFAGDTCGTRDSRFAVDKNGKLRFIGSVIYSDQENQRCEANLTVFRIDRLTIQATSSLSERREFQCLVPPSPASHGEPFKVFSEVELAVKLSKQGNEVDASQLVDFKRKDAADALIKTALWSQGPRWKSLLIDRALEGIDRTRLVSTKPSTDAVKAMRVETDRLSTNVANLQWLSSSATTNALTNSSLEKFRIEIESLKQRLKNLESAAPPQLINESPNAYRRLNIVLQNQIPPQIPAEVAAFTPVNAPFAHFGVLLPSGTPAILYSTMPFSERPAQFNSLLAKSLGAKKYLINGFPQDLLFFQTLTDSEQLEYDSYAQKKKEYLQHLAAYKKSQDQLPAKLAELHTEILRLDTETFRLAGVFK